MQDILTDYSFLKPKLPKGWATILAEKHELTEDSIRKMVKGERQGNKYTEVIEDLIHLAKNHTKKLNELIEKANQI